MSDEVLDLIRGGEKPSQTPAYRELSLANSRRGFRTPAQKEDDQVLDLIQGNTVYGQAQPVEATKPNVPMVRQIFGKALQKGFEAKQALPAFSASLFDIPASLPEFIVKTIAYPEGRAIGMNPEQASELSGKVSAPLAYLKPGKFTGLENTPAYQQSLPTKTMEFIGANIHKGVDWIAQKTGLNPLDVQAAVDVGMLAAPKVVPQAIKTGAKVVEDVKSRLPTVTIERQAPAPTAGGQSVGAAATPNATMVQQAMSVATPELQQALKDIPVNQINVPTFQRHIEADTLPVPVRLTEGQATGDLAKLSQEQNNRGKDPQLADRFAQQNLALIDNIQEIRNRAAPDVYGTKTIENSQGIIDTYKEMDAARSTAISDAYKRLEDANGGQFPVDGVALAKNAEAKLNKKLKTGFLSPTIKSQLDTFKSGAPMTFEQFEAMRTNLATEIRRAEKAGDGNAAQAASIVRQELENLPMQGTSAANLKPLADEARSLAKARFDMLKKDPAYRAAVDDLVPADKFIEKFVINGVNKNVQTMVEHLGKDSPARQHMAAGTINWLSDKAGIYGDQANFSQAGYNKALKKLDDVKNVQEIFDAETAGHLKTLGNVASYTQFQPRGSFVNNSNTTVAAMAANAMEQTANVIGGGKFGLPLGTMVRNKAQEIKAKQQTKKTLEIGAGTKQTGANKINDLNNP